MPTFIVDPGRVGRRYQRPPWPYRLNSDSPQAQGLVRWWPLDRGVGTRDVIALGEVQFLQTAGFRGGPQPVSEGYNFDGATSLSASQTLVTAVPLSLTIWAYPRAFAAAMAAIGIYEFTDTSRFMLDIATGGNTQFIVRNSAGTAGTATGPQLNVANEWNLLGATSGSSTSRHAWRNGVKGTENTTNITPSGLNLSGIGADPGNGSDDLFFDGLLADGRIYNRVLRDDEMFAQWHPDTRWDLYWQPNKRVYFQIAAAGRTAKNTRSNPLGVTVGMGWRMPA